MEGSQLDLNAPIMSVRRISSAAVHQTGEVRKAEQPAANNTIPSYHKPELRSGPVGKTGSVPFVWEQAPGKPKATHGLYSPAPVPILEGKLKAQHQQQCQQLPQQQRLLPSHLLSNDADVSNGSSVIKTQNHISEENLSSLMNCKESWLGHEKHNSEDSDDTFSDARDTLSRSESFFMGGSFNGLSTLDGLDGKSGPLNSEGRQFMIGRFLPAAKAMVSETPRRASRKSAAWEIAWPVNHVDEERPPSSTPYGPYIQPQGGVDDDDRNACMFEDNEDTRSVAPKIGGWLSRFLLRSSLCLLNPVPGMKIRARVPSLPADQRIRASQSAKGGHTVELDPGNEQSWEAVYQYKLSHRQQSHKAQVTGGMRRCESNKLRCCSDSQTTDGSSAIRRSSGNSSSCCNEMTASPFHEGVGHVNSDSGSDSFLSISKSGHGSQEGSGSSSPLLERYASSVPTVKPINSRSSSDSKDLIAPSYAGATLLKANEEAILHSKLASFTAPLCKSFLGRSSGMIEKERTEGFLSEDNINEEQRQNSSSDDLNNTPHLEAAYERSPSAIASEAMHYLPLPKSPSESWLSRALPSMHQRNSPPGFVSKAKLYTRKQAIGVSTVDSKLGSIVRTSN